jgi:hypothetical protein
MKSQIIDVDCSSKSGDVQMRHVQQPMVLTQDTAEFKFNFQMISRGARHACSVAIRATDEVRAAALFRENWSAIEKLARKNLATNTAKQIRLEWREPTGWIRTPDAARDRLRAVGVGGKRKEGRHSRYDRNEREAFDQHGGSD